MARVREIDAGLVLASFAAYVEKTDIPIVAEFAYTQDVSKQYLYDTPELADILKKCLAKKEAALERGMLYGGGEGQMNVTAAIFSLKQLGWSDRHDLTHKGDPLSPLALKLTGSDVQG